MKHFIKYIVPSAAVVLSLGLSSCAGDLDVDPIDPNQTTSGEYLADNLLNKCYANMALAGQSGPDGDSDVDGIDGGTSGFIRQLFNHNELASDNFVCSWGDAGISDFNYIEFNSSNVMTAGLYYRCWTGVKDCNLYLDSYGGADEEKAAEARFMRALYYYELMDNFGNVPFATTLTESPVRITRSDLCKWIVSELRSIENKLSVPTSTPLEGQSGYGRANKYTDQLLLARLYLNSQVYTGTAKNDSALYYAQQVIKNSPYKLHKTAKSSNWTAYQELFMGDNGQNGASEECLLALPQDGATTASYGTTLFLMASMEQSTVEFQNGFTSNNTTEGWAGNRARPELVREFFPRDDAPAEANVRNMYTAAGDDRALFENLGGKTLENTQIATFTKGYTVAKWSNWYAGSGEKHNAKFPDTDFFFFRLAEAYLIEAEADARLNGGTTTTVGTEAINALRSRAHASTKTTGYDLDYICNEWNREFYSELLRRQTLVRFNRYGGSSYNWAWKGGVPDGRGVATTLNLFPIPDQEMNSLGSILIQNPGY